MVMIRIEIIVTLVITVMIVHITPNSGLLVAFTECAEAHGAQDFRVMPFDGKMLVRVVLKIGAYIFGDSTSWGALL